MRVCSCLYMCTRVLLIFENKVTFKRTNSYYIVTYQVVVSRDQIHSGLNTYILYFNLYPFSCQHSKNTEEKLPFK